MMCTTASCCEDAKARFQAATLGFVDMNSVMECELAARYLQLQSTTAFSLGYYGDSYPHGCYLSSGSLYVNKGGAFMGAYMGADLDTSEPCGSGWRNDANNCSSTTLTPTQTPIFKCNSSSTDDASSTTLSSVRISSNAGAGISSAAKRLTIANTLVGLGPSGEHTQGQDTFGNKGDAGGVVLEESATDCRIGVDVDAIAGPYIYDGDGSDDDDDYGYYGYEGNEDDAESTPTIATSTSTTSTRSATSIIGAGVKRSSPFTVYISGNTGSGIQASAPNLRVVNTAVGLEARSADVANDAAAFGAAAAPNKGVAGIELLGTATDCDIGTLTGNQKIKTWIAGNNGNGISATGVSVNISATDVGFNQQGNPVGNKRYGVLVEGDESNRPKFMQDSKVGASGYCGVRVGLSCNVTNDPSELDTVTVYGLAGAAVSANNEDEFMNGQNTIACKRCRCSNTPSASTTTREITIDCSTATSADSSESTAAEPPPNFGRDFFSSIPENTVRLLMPSAKVTWVNWSMLAAANETLRVLDLSGNHLLENPFPPPDISFLKLTTLNLRGTNLGGLTPTSVQDMCGGDGYGPFELQSLDLSAIEHTTVPTTPLILDLTGFTNLTAFAWHNKTTCPPGFYPTTDSPSNPLDSLCGKCPSGTEKLHSGGTLDNCTYCPDGLFDLDNDASTKCEASYFKVLEFEHYIPPAKEWLPKDQNEAKYAFSKSRNDPLNNDLVRLTPEIASAEKRQPYFGKRNNTITNTDTTTITSYQTFYADVPVILPPINATKTQSKSSGNITFTVDGLTDDFFINPDNGAIFGNPSLPESDNYTFKVSVYAVDSNGARAVVETIQFTVIKQDTLDPKNGPGKKNCTHGKTDDGVKFDGKFTCDCTGSGYTDDNCNTSIAAKHAKIIIGIIFGCLLIGCVAWKVRQQQAVENDAKAALLRAFRAYGILPPGASSHAQGTISINSGDLVGVTTTPNPAFVGLGTFATLPLAEPNSDAVPLLDIAIPDASAGYTADQLVYADNDDGGGGESDVAAALVSTVATTALSAVNQIYLVTDGSDDSEDSGDNNDGGDLLAAAPLPTVATAAASSTTTANPKKKPKQRRKGLSKFVAPTISLGKSTLAAKGLDTLLGIDPKTYMHVKRKVKVMLKEFAKGGTSEDNRNITTLLNGTYKHPPNSDGSPLTADDIRGQSITMEELMASDPVKGAGLERHHVLALRLYTTSSYRSINNPMRQSPPVLPHPFAATLYYISDALSKLRELQGKDLAMRNESQVFWRGMKDLQITDTFVRTGGSEMACMSTTSSRQVAEDFAFSKSPLLFKFVSNSFMSHGADIGFLSVYPGEKEVLYPPLTYLRPIRLYKETIGSAEFQVAEVEPVFPK